MPWVRIDENAMDHPKIGGLSDGAFRLWVQALAYCQKYLTDGAVSLVALRGLRAYSPARRRALTSVGLWLEVDGGGIAVHDYLQWNESREHVMRVRLLARERIQKLRGKRSSNAVTACEPTENERSSYSGGVVCSSLSSETNEGGLGETTPRTLPQRAGAFCEWYADKHTQIFNIGYIGNPQKDYETAQRLCAVFGDEELRDAAIVWFGHKDKFAVTGTRTIPKFASRATECVQTARQVPA
jgi:hypothetical protein